MRFLPLRSCVTMFLIASAFIFSGCQKDKKPAGGGKTTVGHSGSGGTHTTTRVPNGAGSKHEAAVRFFNAYKTHNRAAAKEVASDAVVNELRFNPGAGTNPTLQLVDDSHIYYEGGSIEMTFAQNSAGRWYVRSVTSTAD